MGEVYLEAQAPDTLAGVKLTDEEKKVYSATFIDEAKTRAANQQQEPQLRDFPFSEKELKERAQLLQIKNLGVKDASLLAEDFQFVGPVVGPLGKKEFLSAFGGFRLEDGFPDIRSGLHSFRIDPFQPNRMWFVGRVKATHSGTFAGFAPTGKVVLSPPQAASMTFNNQGQLQKLTAGYVMDRQIGNTGGLGGVFAFFYAIGKPLPFPEGQPWQMSWRYKLFNKFGSFIQSFSQNKD